MKFGFGSKSKSADEQSSADNVEAGQDAASAGSPIEDAPEKGRGSATTPKKGRPTPSRREAERARGQRSGPVTAPLTRKEAKERKKVEKNSMSKEERKVARARANAAREERRQAMLDGDDRYVLERDRGPQRRYARDWVDTHRRISNYFMPVALIIIVFQFFPIPSLIGIFQIAFLLVIVLVIIDTILVGRTVNRAVAERFGEEANTGFGLGFYAAMRAMQPKSLRTPRPRVKPGDEIPGN